MPATATAPDDDVRLPHPVHMQHVHTQDGRPARWPMDLAVFLQISGVILVLFLIYGTVVSVLYGL